MWVPVFECVVGVDGERGYRVGHKLIDQFLEFVGARAIGVVRCAGDRPVLVLRPGVLLHAPS
jgi:hypothetical protein